MTAIMTPTSLLLTSQIAVLIFIPTLANDLTIPCRGKMSLIANETEGYLSSPNSFKSSPNKMECECHLSTGSNSSIILAELITLKLDEDTSNCTSDYLEVHDGPDKTSPLIRRFCGNDSYGTFSSTSSDLTVVFYSDGLNKNNSGFTIEFLARKKTNKPVDSCTGVSLLATEVVNYLTSPNYPDWYPSNTDCQWHIRTDLQKRKVQLTFLDFTLEEREPNCTNDYVKVYDGPSTASRELIALCGMHEFYWVHSTSNNMTVAFHSDGKNNYKGFKLSYKIYGSDAGHSIHNTISVFAVVICSVGMLGFM